jgi:hypothetical protein
MSADAATEQQQDGGGDAAMERLSAKLAKAAGGADLAGLKEIVQDFYRDAVDLRTKNRELSRERDDLKKRLPKDGDVVLTGDEAKAMTALRKLDVPLTELPKKLAEGQTAATENAAFKRDSTVEQAAKALGWNATVLKGLVRLNGLAIDKQTTKGQDGEKVDSWVVMPAEDAGDDDPTPLAEYVEQHLGDFRDALAGPEAGRKSDREPPTPSGPRMVRQRSGESGPGKGVTDAQVETDLRTRHHFGI